MAYTYDACTRNDPVLRLDAGTLRLTFNEHLERGCYRPIDTYVIFRVDTADLPDPTVYGTCRSTGQVIQWSGGRVVGEPCGR